MKLKIILFGIATSLLLSTAIFAQDSHRFRRWQMLDLFDGTPNTPASLTATGDVADITLSGYSVTGATSYYIGRGTTANNISIIDTTTEITYLDSALIEESVYYYSVKAVKNNEASGFSPVAYDTVLAFMYAVDLDGSTELMLKTDPVNINLTGFPRLRSLNGIMLSVSDSIKGHWVLDTVYANNNSVDSIGKDLTANAINLTSVGTKTFTGVNPVYDGDAMYFNGSSFLYSNSTKLNFTNTSFSIEVWIKTTYNALEYVLGKHEADNNYFIRIEDNGNVSGKIAGTGGSKQIFSSIKVNDGQWHKIDFTNTVNSTCSLYVDGQLQATATHTVSNINTSADFLIGGLESDFGGTPFTGWISEVRILRRVLTAQEIRNDYCRYTEKGFDDEWTNTGNHSIDSTTTLPQDGTYAGKIISTGAGSSPANYVSLPIAEPLLSGSKYMIQYYVKTIFASSDSITSVLGSTSTKMAVTTSWVKKTFHIAPTSTISSIKFFLNQADTMYIDGLVIQKKYDALFLAWVKTAKGDAAQYVFKNGGETPVGIYCNTTTLNRISVTLRDDVPTNFNVLKTKAYSDDAWHLFAWWVDWTGNLSLTLDDAAAGTTSIITAGYTNINTNIYVGTQTTSFKWQGLLGKMQLYKFDSIPTIATTPIYNSGRLPTNINGITPTLQYDWRGTNLLEDKAGVNHLTGTNVDINDQVKVGATYR